MMREKRMLLSLYLEDGGTLEEITEVITLKQLEYIINQLFFLIRMIFTSIFSFFISNIRKEGFVSKAYEGCILL